jgi:hypothetical protein
MERSNGKRHNGYTWLRQRLDEARDAEQTLVKQRDEAVQQSHAHALEARQLRRDLDNAQRDLAEAHRAIVRMVLR